MTSACQVCGKGLSFTQRARGRSVCDPCTDLTPREVQEALRFENRPGFVAG